MGTFYSKEEICECPVSKSRSRTGKGVKAKPDLIETQTKASQKLQPAELGAGPSSMKPVKPLTTHKYNLRPRNKHAGEVVTASMFLKEKPQCKDGTLGLVTKLKTMTISEKGGQEHNNSVDEDNREDELPKHVLYYGWFFTEEVSTRIHSAVMYYFRLCYDQVPQFQRFMETCCKEADEKNPFEYYKRPKKRAKPGDPLLYHLTARFLGREPDVPYQTMVAPFLKKIFCIHLVGIVFTPRTLGVRVKLTPSQELIFDEKDDARNLCDIESNSSKVQNLLETELQSYASSYKLHKKSFPNCTLKTVPGTQLIFQKVSSSFPTNYVDQMKSKSRAHVTIGCAPNVAAKQTGDDLVDIVDLEGRSASTDSNFQSDYKLERGTLRQFGRYANAFVLYPDTEMIVPGELNVFI